MPNYKVIYKDRSHVHMNAEDWQDAFHLALARPRVDEIQSIELEVTKDEEKYKSYIDNKNCMSCIYVTSMPCWNGIAAMTFKNNNNGMCPPERKFTADTLKNIKKRCEAFWGGE